MDKEINQPQLNDDLTLEFLNKNKNKDSSESKWALQKKKWLNVGIALVIIIIIEYLTRDYSKIYTLKIFGSTDKDLIKYLEYFEFYSLGGRYFLCFLILSYVNVYSALTYMFLDCFVVFLNGILRFFYLDDRPFWKHPEYFPSFCATDYGNPSTTGIDIFIMFAVFYRAFTYKSNNNFFNWSLWIVIVLNIAYLYIIRMMGNVHYLHQLLYGSAIGYLIYYITFEIFELDFDNPKQFITLLENWELMAAIITGVFTIVTIIHLNLNLEVPPEEEIRMIEENCKLNAFFSFDQESYSKSTRIFEFLGCFMGSWFEYILIFKKNSLTFGKYNVVSDENMYRHTSSFVSFIRFVLLFIIQQYLFSYLILNKSNFESFPKASFFSRLIFLQSIPLFIHGVLIFFGMKVVIPYLYLTNESIWATQNKNALQEDIEDQKGLLFSSK